MKWTDDELVVLLALFVSQPFAAGDDSHPTCRAIARALKRTPAAIDNQWRNIKYHLFRLDRYGVADRHVGENVESVVDRFRINLGKLRREAVSAMGRNRWRLKRYLGK
jgi:hypothetical protein